MLKLLRTDVSNKQGMAYEFKGQQPVVVMKQSNVCGAKGHSRNNEFQRFSDGTPCAMKVACTVWRRGKQPGTDNADGDCYLFLL